MNIEVVSVHDLLRSGQKELALSSETARDLMPSWLGRELIVGDFTPKDLRALARESWGYLG